jgi:hypothetical protein
VTKEQVYDAEISPLMAQIIDICKREKIAMLASFDLGQGPESEEDGDHLMCTTAILEDSHDPAPRLISACNIIYNHSSRVAMLNVIGGDGKIKESHAIIG